MTCDLFYRSITQNKTALSFFAPLAVTGILSW